MWSCLWVPIIIVSIIPFDGKGCGLEDHRYGKSGTCNSFHTTTSPGKRPWPWVLHPSWATALEKLLFPTMYGNCFHFPHCYTWVALASIVLNKRRHSQEMYGQIPSGVCRVGNPQRPRAGERWPGAGGGGGRTGSGWPLKGTRVLSWWGQCSKLWRWLHNSVSTLRTTELISWIM